MGSVITLSQAIIDIDASEFTGSLIKRMTKLAFSVLESEIEQLRKELESEAQVRLIRKRKYTAKIIVDADRLAEITSAMFRVELTEHVRKQS